MEHLNKSKSLRTFLGAKEYKKSRLFYEELGFTVKDLFHNMALVSIHGNMHFYLQDYYKKAWCNNTMMFLEIEDLDAWHEQVASLELPSKYVNVKLSEIVEKDWGREFFLHDPSGILWHFGTFHD